MQQALIIIDVQNDYFPQGNMELNQAEQALQQVLTLRDHFRQQQLPIFYILHTNLDPAATFFRPNTQGEALHPQLLPLQSEQEKIVPKNYPNSFFKTDLQQQLAHHNIKQLIICGMMSHMCVDSTTRCAAELGYQPILIDDACTTRDLTFKNNIIPANQVHNSFMAALARFAQIQSTQEFISTHQQ